MKLLCQGEIWTSMFTAALFIISWHPSLRLDAFTENVYFEFPAWNSGIVCFSDFPALGVSLLFSEKALSSHLNQMIRFSSHFVWKERSRWVSSSGKSSFIFVYLTVSVLVARGIFSLRCRDLRCSIGGLYLLACKIFSCRMWDPVPWPGIEPRPPALGAWSLSHRTTREVPSHYSFGERVSF